MFGILEKLWRKCTVPERSNSHFGEHLMIDGYGGSPEKLNDEELVRQCLDELPRMMTIS